jgi:hypothetical protein
MAAAAFTKFDPRAFLENEKREGEAAKVAKVAKVAERSASPVDTFAGFAAFAEEPTQNENYGPKPEPWTDAHEERAAIGEYDGCLPRVWAEGFARLDPSKPPPDVPAKRWLRFIDDCGHFLDAGWADKASAFGWGPLDLFGCDRERPFARVDHLGLLWLLKGGTIIELNRDRAILQTESGAAQTYRRRPVEVGRVVLAWELIS